MTTFLQPELMTKKERERMARYFGLPKDAFEADLHPEKVIEWKGEKMTLEELRQRMAEGKS